MNRIHTCVALAAVAGLSLAVMMHRRSSPTLAARPMPVTVPEDQVPPAALCLASDEIDGYEAIASIGSVDAEGLPTDVQLTASSALPSVAELSRSPRFNPRGIALEPERQIALQTLVNDTNTMVEHLNGVILSQQIEIIARHTRDGTIQAVARNHRELVRGANDRTVIVARRGQQPSRLELTDEESALITELQQEIRRCIDQALAEIQESFS